MERDMQWPKIILSPLPGTMLTAAVLFLSAGRWDLPMFWITVVLGWLLAGLRLACCDSGLVAERAKPGENGCDRVVPAVGKAIWGVSMILASLDVGRYHWSDTVPLSVGIPALIGYASGLSLQIWAVAVNRFFSPVVRVQAERGHQVVRQGPYRFIRHPGYAGFLLSLPCLGLALGSWLSLVPAVVLGVLIIRRTLIEDRYLHEHLAGYADYASEIRYRLIAGIW